MRIELCAFLLLITAWTDAAPPVIDRVEMRLSGWESVDIAVNRQGSGNYHLSDPPPAGKDGTFSLPPQHFDQLLKRLEPYREKAVPFTDASAIEFQLQQCPKGVPFMTDQGAFYVRWVSSTSDQHYLADLGCDPSRFRARNEELLAVIQSLPVPLVW